jgi:hypothetical protein
MPPLLLLLQQQLLQGPTNEKQSPTAASPSG